MLLMFWGMFVGEHVHEQAGKLSLRFESLMEAQEGAEGKTQQGRESVNKSSRFELGGGGQAPRTRLTGVQWGVIREKKGVAAKHTNNLSQFALSCFPYKDHSVLQTWLNQASRCLCLQSPYSHCPGLHSMPESSSPDQNPDLVIYTLSRALTTRPNFLTAVDVSVCRYLSVLLAIK